MASALTERSPTDLFVVTNRYFNRGYLSIQGSVVRLNRHRQRIESVRLWIARPALRTSGRSTIVAVAYSSLFCELVTLKGQQERDQIVFFVFGKTDAEPLVVEIDGCI